MRDLTYFMSDLHLGAGYIADHREHELKVVNFLRSIEPRARRLILLGDILDKHGLLVGVPRRGAAWLYPLFR